MRIVSFNMQYSLGADGRYRWHWDPRFMSPERRLQDREEFLENCARRLTLPTLLVRGGLSDVLTEEGAQAFLALDREAVATVCRALGDLGASEKLMFWLREHGALAGKGVAAALDAGVAVSKVERLATAWARERGAARVAAAA